VKTVLAEVVSSGEQFVDAAYLQPAADRYARRLLHRDPQGRYSVVVMVWGTDQGTPLHDHAGVWCVECVYRGRIRVTSFDLESGPDADRAYAGIGGVCRRRRAGASAAVRHMIENADRTPSVTLHVYGGELTWCNAFHPLEAGGYRRERRTLSYTD
jgi:predicted metal-dependent enzyme (double-stranded beta helix superfamily)